MRASRAILAGGAALGPGATALAHDEAPASPADLWTAWALDPWVIVSLALSAWLYARGLRRLWRRSRAGAGVKRWEALCFSCGWVTLVVALVSPLHAWGEALFSVHMIQHELLMLVAAPLIVLGRPLPVFLIALPARLAADLARGAGRPPWRHIWRFSANPLAAWMLHAAILWLWHLPAAFDAVLGSDLAHALQHASFFGSALLFWWAAMQGGRAIGYGAAVLYMFTTAMHSGLLGAMITLASRAWYPGYELSAPQWGLTPLEDQQLGGLIMWVPAGIVYIVAALALVAGWMREAERRIVRWESLAREG